MRLRTSMSLIFALLLSACGVVPMHTRTTPEGKTVVEKPSFRLYSSEDKSEELRFKMKRKGLVLQYKREF